MRIRCAITELVPTKPLRNTLTSIVPIGLAISSAKKLATGKHASIGYATLEAELLDSMTNTRLAVAIDRKVGEKYKLKKGMTKWAHIEGAFQFWAERLRKFMDTAHGKRQYEYR